ncbi:hypothetical protein EVAR_63080_1 [Eumeta japonica]|uniref:Uncharacterized protein n=1 Tax=Eumeta variegata TaxID=151549 RepID=A0A4C2A0K6_EUMVA|nr:hypothetical protein EVAR_63080_1 [Eumeta japonica]
MSSLMRTELNLQIKGGSLSQQEGSRALPRAGARLADSSTCRRYANEVVHPACRPAPPSPPSPRPRRHGPAPREPTRPRTLVISQDGLNIRPLLTVIIT